MVWALKKLRPYLLGSNFVVYTDHKPLTCLFTNDLDNTKIQRWAILINEYAATIKYRPRAKNVCADMLSRIEPAEDCEVAILDAEDLVPLDPEPDLDDTQIPFLADGLDKDEVRKLQKEEFGSAMEEANKDEVLYSISKPQDNDPVYPQLLLPEKYHLGVIRKLVT